MFLGDATIPEGLRVYAIGDVHGCDDRLAEAHRKIADDLATRAVDDHRIIHLGDYVDRGPASDAVLARLARLSRDDPRIICLRGNHDQMMIDFLADPAAGGAMWLMNGGDRTIANYGVTRGWRESNRALVELRDRLARAVPADQIAFLENLDDSVRFGDFYFCHAGIRPGVALDAQSREDLTWIREEFLDDARDHGVVVVHGHTPQPRPEVRRNRINVDTGAVFGGPLTVVCLEGTSHDFMAIERV
jgi:serine/threonine protein phosphatase 1